jgi:predicted molibdopterin-dependent oxidoreductase YjgC
MAAMPQHAAVRIATAQRGARVTIRVDGRPVEAHAGEMLAAALMAAGIFRLRQSPNAGTPRGAFCLMGVCQECLVRVGGELRQSCMVPVAAGLEVATGEPQ